MKNLVFMLYMRMLYLELNGSFGKLAKAVNKMSYCLNLEKSQLSSNVRLLVGQEGQKSNDIIILLHLLNLYYG